MNKKVTLALICLSMTSGCIFTAPTKEEPMTKTVETANGLQYVILEEGKPDARVAHKGNTAIVHYTGWLQEKNGEKGTQFDSSYNRNEPFSFLLGSGMVIKGWDEGVQGMKIGEKRMLIIKPELGYGARGVGAIIPPNATLIFEVTLVDLK